MKIESLGLNNAERKVAALILELAGKTGIINQNRIEIKRIPFSMIWQIWLALQEKQFQEHCIILPSAV